ncbi:hypothetical protein MNBD_BACTEROID05-865 [hydrothermal vent metagenome]|uniref:Uncharacterized protein n=1 Tax=hydrothermal vent metagenome TaxID=652676 RepID=A0A3B0TCS9_9ZZZZ
MILNIGIVSGEILEVFDEVKNPLTERELEVYLGHSQEKILMSLGWLVREGFLTVEEKCGNTFFACKKEANKEYMLINH